MEDLRAQIEEIVHRETRAWDTQDAALLLTVFHPDMVWPWPAHNQAHDPLDWVMEYGRYNAERWGRNWQALFDAFTLTHNHRVICKIEVSPEGDGAFAVVDIDTCWRAADGAEMRWLGRTCKAYALTPDGWKMTMQTGVLQYPPR